MKMLIDKNNEDYRVEQVEELKRERQRFKRILGKVKLAIKHLESFLFISGTSYTC